MIRNRTLRQSAVILAAAWLMAIPALYLLYDYWMRGLDALASRREMLRPYAFFVGICPLVLFWAGSAIAAAGAARAAQQAAADRAPAGLRALIRAVLVLGVVGGLLGTAAAVPVLLTMLSALGKGQVPVGLLALLGGLSAAGIWLLRTALGRFREAGA